LEQVAVLEVEVQMEGLEHQEVVMVIGGMEQVEQVGIKTL
jgi:hypothetical protein